MAEANQPEPLPEIDTLTFEDAFRRLGDMAASLEDGGLTLAEATDRYEQGMGLVLRCNQLLDEAQLKITNLKDAYTTAGAGNDSNEDFFSSPPDFFEESEEPSDS